MEAVGVVEAGGWEVEELELAQFLDDVMCWLGSSRG
jgi:hypothetical protein